jgi:hypothetical protein
VKVAYLWKEKLLLITFSIHCLLLTSYSFTLPINDTDGSSSDEDEESCNNSKVWLSEDASHQGSGVIELSGWGLHEHRDKADKVDQEWFHRLRNYYI